MRLLHVEYWTGKKKTPILVVLIEITRDNRLIGLRSDKLSNADVKKIRDNTEKLKKKSQGELRSWMRQNVTYSKSVIDLKPGRYNIIKEYSIG